MSVVATSLLTKIAGRSYAVPIEVVVETMRPLPRAADGTSVVRGEAIPVAEGAALAGGDAIATRLVVLRAGDARVGLLVDAVIGVRERVGTTGAPLAGATAGLSPELARALARVRLVDAPGDATRATSR